MRYILKCDYILRGWLDAPYGIVNLSNGNKFFYNSQQYAIIRQCDGITQQAMSDYLQELINTGFIKPALDNEELDPQQIYKQYPCNSYLSVEFSVTRRCNYSCRHCYISANNTSEEKDLSLSECLHIIDNISEAGIFQMELTGGECIMRNDFNQLLSALSQKQITVNAILSNGALLNSKILKSLETLKVKPIIQVSFDGVHDGHNWLRNSKKAEPQTVRGIKLLKENGYRVCVSMTVHRGNVDTIRDTVLLLSKLKVDNLYVGHIADIGNWIKENRVYNMTAQEYYNAYLKYIPQYIADEMPINIRLGDIFQCQKSSTNYSFPIKSRGDKKNGKPTGCVCPIAANKLYISFDGTVLPCPIYFGSPIKQQMPNVLSMPLVGILQNSIYSQFSRLTYENLSKTNSKCIKCFHLNKCGGKCHFDDSCDEVQFRQERDMACVFFKEGYEARIEETWNNNINL